jgi:hypothetical protein
VEQAVAVEEEGVKVKEKGGGGEGVGGGEGIYSVGGRGGRGYIV